jgi:hypothetical protein
MEERQISIKEFIKAIKPLPEDEKKEQEGVWYLSQKEHWLGWLGDYLGPGAYGRKNWNRDAKFAYNHIVCPELLLYLVKAIPLRVNLIEAAENAYLSESTLMGKAGAIRKVVPWSEIYNAFWGKGKPSFLEKIRRHLALLNREDY